MPHGFKENQDFNRAVVNTARRINEARRKANNHPNRAKHFYLLFNHYGSSTSIGFQNTWSALAFENRDERDAYVSRWELRNKSIRPCTRREALQYAETDPYVSGYHFRLYDPDYSGGDVKPSDWPICPL